MSDQPQDHNPFAEAAAALAAPVYDQLQTIVKACYNAAGPDGVDTFRRAVAHVLTWAGARGVDVGPCFDRCPFTAAGVPAPVCTLPAGHDGAHADGSGSSWTNDAPTLTAELAACRQELAVQVARANGAEADRDLVLAQPGAVPEIQGRLRRIAEAQLREMDVEVRRLRALVPLEQRHARTAGDG